MRITTILVATAATLGALALLPSPAQAADLSPCGDIDVKANANCTLVTSGGCTAQCTPVHFKAACSAKLQATCTGQCTVSPEVSCTGSCSGDCTGACNSNPGNFDCSTNCRTSCDASCTSQCSSSANSSDCTTQCQANCNGSCSAKCEGTPPSATCDAKCQASCNGSCTAKANATCNIACQARGEASCEAELDGGCKAHCSEPKGALFCDGQYVDTGNNLQSCIDALRATFNIQVSASGECSGNTCTGSASASTKCALAQDEPLSGAGILAGIAVCVGSLARKRRKAA